MFSMLSSPTRYRSAKSARRWLVPAGLWLALLLPAAPAANDVPLPLPDNFDVSGLRGWTSNSCSGRVELAPEHAKLTLLQFRGNRVTAGDSRTDQVPGRGGGTTFIHYETRMEATYDNGRLSGTYEQTSKNWNQGYPADSGIPNREYSRSTLKGTISGQANTDGILTVSMHTTQDEVFHNLRGSGWSKTDVQPSLPSWCMDFQLPVGDLQSAQPLSEVMPATTTAAIPGPHPGPDANPAATPAAPPRATPLRHSRRPRRWRCQRTRRSLELPLRRLR